MIRRPHRSPPHQPPPAPGHDRWPGATAGAAMIVSLCSLAVVAMFAVTLLQAVKTEGEGVTLEHHRTQAFKSAEGLLDRAAYELVQTMANFQPFPAPPASEPYQLLTGTTSQGPLSGTWTVSQATMRGTSGSTILVPPTTVTDPITGLNKVVESYLLAATARFGMSTVTMRRHIQAEKIPIFQFLAFYDQDLEILPGPAMTLAGRIHTNQDLYTAPGASLTVDTKYFRAAGDFYRHRKDSTALPAGWIKIRDAASGGSLRTLPSSSDYAAVGIGSQYGLDSHFTGWDLNHDFRFDLPGEKPPFMTEAENLFHGTLQTGEHGVTPLGHPAIGSIQAYEVMPGGTGGNYVPGAQPGQYVAVAPGTGSHKKGYYHANADLVVINNRVYNKAGTDITASMPAGFLTTRTLWDQRENRTVTTTVINLARLGDMDGNPNTLDPCPYYPPNGLLFATRTDAVPGQPNGVVLTGGSQLNVPDKWNLAAYGGASPRYTGPAPAGAYNFSPAELTGLTVVSPTPVYVHGDYNTVARKPAAVITDTINLLSNAWNYSKTPGTSKVATNTTYNLAMITGNLETSTGHYNGGFENLPRFHENWSGKTCTIRGSFVNTWRSGIANGPWVYGGAYYDAPNRAWSYDTDFDLGRLPPFTPLVINTKSVAWEVSQ